MVLDLYSFAHDESELTERIDLNYVLDLYSFAHDESTESSNRKNPISFRPLQFCTE